MGFSQGAHFHSREPPNPTTNAPNSSSFSSSSSSVVTDYYCDHNELKIKTILRKMIWELGFACVRPPRRRRSSDNKNHSEGDNNDNGNNSKNKNLEHNKAWLLAESGGCGAELTNADPQSVHSSFRFSFCSQVELESMNMSSSTAATVLMVNLDNGVCESRARELKWRRIESLERSISPVANTLVRFGYGEILSATRNFSKGMLMGMLLFVLIFNLLFFLHGKKIHEFCCFG